VLLVTSGGYEANVEHTGHLQVRELNNFNLLQVRSFRVHVTPVSWIEEL
jgi:hypothetical protein